MIRSRQEVDKYVSAAIRNLSSPHEQNLKGYAFARMYYEAQDYDKAIHYITVYLSVNQSDAKGHRLLGKIQQTKKHYEKAIDSYRRSYELNNTQRDLVLQVAELYCHVRTDPQRAQYWVDQATRFFQGHKTIFKLREHLLRINGASVKEIEDFLVTEMASSPDNVDLHIKLVKLYKDNKRLDEAYNRCIQCERNKLFSNNLQWFVLQADLLQAYLKSKEKSNNNKLIQDIYVNLLNVASKVVLLSMEQHDAYAESTDCLARFDQYLLNAYNYCPINNDDEETEWTVALREMRGQLYYLCGVLITKMAFKGAIEWSEALSLTAVCYLASLEISLPNTQTAWMATAMRNNAQEPMRWYYIACNRLSQVAHLVDNLYEHHGGEWLDKTCEKWCSPQGREEIFYKLFSCRYNSAKSFFHQDIKFCQVNGNDALANIDDDLITYDEGVVADQPHSLRHIIWLALQWFSQSSDVQPDVVFLLAPAFEKLHYNVQNLQSVAVETICQLDIQSFVYAVVYCSKHLIREQYIEHHMSDYQQEMLPLCLSKKLVTTEQEEWWNAVCSLYTGKASASERSKLRLKAQKGLEVIRVIGKHGIQTELLVHLAKCFASRMNETRQMSEQQWYFQDQYLCLQSRAALYWEGVLPILERFAQDMNVSKPSNPFFKHVESSLQLSQVREYIREGMKFVASMTFEKGDHEKALELFETIGNADAVFNQAMIYKLLSQRIMEDKEGDIDSDDERKKLDLLKKSRECLYMAVDKLGTRSDDPLNRKIAEALEEVDSILDTLTPVTRRLNFNGSVSSVSESGDVTSPLDRPVLESTVREDQPCVLYDPSPRRIAAELRNLNSSHTKLVENHSKLLEKYSELQNNYGKSQQQIETLSKQLSDVMKQLKDIQTSQRPEPPQAAAASSPKSTMTHEQQILILAHQLQQIGSDVQDIKRLSVTPVPMVPPSMQELHYSYAYRQRFPHLMPPITASVVQPSSVGSVTVTTATSSALHGYVGGMPGLIPPHVDSAYGSMASQPVTAISTLTDSFHAATTSTESSLPSRPGFVASTTTVESGGIFPRFSFASQGTGDYNFAAPLIQHETVPRPDSYFGSAIQSYNNTTTSVSLSTSNQAYLIGSESSEIPDKPKEAPAPPAQTSIFGTRTGASELTFQDMANSNKTTSFGDGGAFKGAGRKLFEQNKDVTEEESGEEGDTTDDGIHFEPIVQMPEHVELITGEEDEEVVYSERAKLYRYDTDVNQWKERGVGKFKLLKHRVSGRIRILMRRDQVFKVCANHYLTPDIKMKPNTTSDRSLVWTAIDFADEQPKQEMFAIKFKTPEMAVAFKNKFEECQELLKNAPTTTEITATKKQIEGKVEKQSLSDIFKPKVGSWECSQCLISNPADKNKCMACSYQRPGGDASGKDVKMTASASPGFSFGKPSTTNEKSSGLTIGSGTSVPQTGTGFTFGASPQVGTSVTQATSGSTTTFGSGTSVPQTGTGFTFGASPQVGTSVTQATSRGTTTFGSGMSVPQTGTGFTFGASPQVGTSVTQATSGSTTTFGSGMSVPQTGTGFTFGASPQVGTSVTQATSGSTTTFGSGTSVPQTGTGFTFGASPQVGTSVTQATSGSTTTFGSGTSVPQTGTGFTFGASPQVGTSVSQATTGFSFGTSSYQTTSGTPKNSGFSFGAVTSESTNTPATASTGIISKFSFGTPASQSSFSFVSPEQKLQPVSQTDGGFSFGSSAAATLSALAAQRQKDEEPNAAPASVATTTVESNKSTFTLSDSAFKGFSIPSTVPSSFSQQSYGDQVEDEDDNDGYYEGEDGDYYDEYEDYYAYSNEEDGEEEEDDDDDDDDDAGNEERYRSPMHRLGYAETAVSQQVQDKPQFDDSDVTFVSELKPNEEQLKKARELQLPDGFYLYEQSPPCPGCRGCDDDLGKPEKSLSSYMGEPPRLIKKSELSTMKTHSDGKTLVIVTSPGKALGTQIIQQNQESTPGDQPFSDTKKGGLTFEGIASSSQGHGFSFGKTSGSFKGFAGAGSQLFGHSKNEGDEDGYFEDDAGDNIHFEPVAQLPENVDLSTGEEDEEILYKERAKLYRFDHSNGQWKERGVGTLKLLRHCKTGHIRLLMRRDQVHKVCANHRITTSMKLTENAGSDRTWVWNAMDYADEKPKLEQLAVKFKFPTIANEFKNMFEKCQEMLANCAPTTPEKPPSVSPNSKASPLLMSLLTTDSKTEQGKTLTQLFKPPPGSWICKVCEVRNEVSKTACLACCTPKDGAEGSEESSASGTKGFSFGTSTESQGLGSFTFGYQPQKSETDRKTFTGFTFSSTKSDADNKDTPKAFSGFSFGSVKSNTSAPVEFDGGSTSKSAFGLSLTSLTTSVEGSSEKSQLNKSTASQGDDYYNSDEGDHIHFEPIVSMPEKVDLKTGEEDEESIFSHRAKLYRFDAGLSQWKERGVGDIKILQHRETSKARIVMRREQVLKLCANHYITDEMTLKPNAGSDLSWVWNAVDGSEGEPQTEQLAVKFKTANTAKYFHDKFLAAQESQKLAKAEDSQKIASPVKEGCLRTLISPPKFTHVPHVSDNSGDSSATSSEARAAKPSTFATFSFGKQYEKPSSSTSSIFGESKSQEKTAIDPDFVEVVFENKPSSQQVTDAKKYKLPATFYLYEEKPPCIGCRGCSDKLPDDWDSWTDRLNKPLYLDDSRAETPRPESTMKGEKDKYFDSSNSASFGTVASESPDGFLFGKKDPSFKFQGAGSMLFGSSSSRISDAEGDQVVPSDDIHFEPIVLLPEKVDLKTGEEEEEPMFSQRARLYRFDQSAQQWKERGIGILKLLKHSKTGRIRVLMRRDQVLKVCANHYITSAMELRPNTGSDRSWVWCALDFSEEEAKDEQLAVKFKTPELAMNFKDVFEKCQKMISDLPAVKEEVIIENPSSSSDAKAVTQGFGDKFKPKAGAWECGACYLSNSADSNSCIACATSRPGYETTEPVTSSTSQSEGQQFKFGTPSSSLFSSPASSKPSTGFLFGVPPSAQSQSTEPKEENITSSTSSTFPSSSGFNFGFGKSFTTPSKAGEKPDASGSETKSAFSFNLAPTFSIGSDFGKKDGTTIECIKSDDIVSSSSDISQTTTSKLSSTTVNEELKSKTFSGPTFLDLAAKSDTSGFSFSINLEEALSPKKLDSPDKAHSPAQYKHSDSKDDSYYKSEEEGDSIHFEPIAHLPENVDLVTGEEDEHILYSHRVKMYRFDQELKQWKDRGTGDLKILQNKENGHVRILMRRERVFNVCANHYLTSEMTLVPNAGSDRSWVWNALDASDGEPKPEQLAVKFKTPDVADEFKVKFEEAQKLIACSPKKCIDTVQSDDGDEDDTQATTVEQVEADSTVNPRESSSTIAGAPNKPLDDIIRSCDPHLAEALQEVIEEVDTDRYVNDQEER